jgi:hypothetical protein
MSWSAFAMAMSRSRSPGFVMLLLMYVP